MDSTGQVSGRLRSNEKYHVDSLTKYRSLLIGGILSLSIIPFKDDDE